MNNDLSLFGGRGFILSHYKQLYPSSFVEPREGLMPLCDDVIYGISTTSNYAVRNGDFFIDIDTNLRHLMKVLPNVRGTFTFLSSWFVWGPAAGQDSKHPAHETDLCDPRGFYGATKLAAEHLVRSYCNTNGKAYRILRLCNVIGNDPRANNQKAALEWMLAKVVRGEDVNVYDGEGYRAWAHVDDVVRAIRLCVEKAPLNEIVNVGPMRSDRTIDLIKHAITVTGSKSRINIVTPPHFHQTVQTDSFHMDTTKLQSLGFAPKVDAFGAVDRVLEGILLDNVTESLNRFNQSVDKHVARPAL